MKTYHGLFQAKKNKCKAAVLTNPSKCKDPGSVCSDMPLVAHDNSYIGLAEDSKQLSHAGGVPASRARTAAKLRRASRSSTDTPASKMNK
eukprot:6214807-Pleurochrysis_carterae.AAC.10